ncbi:hypothetical protein MKX01_030917 [Papaver californicum]|nr:hypothetical protein MKX01_030917 [Papaver californicum]
MEKSSPKKISYLRFLLVFVVALILVWEQKNSPVVAEYDDDTPDCCNCKRNVSQLLPSRYKHFTNMTCADLWSPFTLRYFKSKDHIMTIIVSASYTRGWVAMGFSPKGIMAGSSAMVGWIGEHNKASIKQYYLEAAEELMVKPDMGDLKLTHVKPAVVLYRSTIYLAFQMHFGSRKSQQSILLAYSDKTPVDDHLKEHIERTTITFDFSQGSFAEALRNLEDSFMTFKNSHRIFSIFGWGVLLPAGAIISRYYRHHDPLWYYLHASIQSMGCIFVLVTILAGELFYTEDEPDIWLHRALGYLTLVLCILQVLAFVKRPSLDSKMRWYWNCYHALVGRTALFLGALNIIIGLEIGGSSIPWKVGYGVLLAVILVTVIILEALSWLGRPVKIRSPAFKTNLDH